MIKALQFQNEKSDKFWTIRTYDTDYVVNYGKKGTQGRSEIKEFASKEECLIQAEKQIQAKKKKGYVDFIEFEADKRFYFDIGEYGPHVLTSHPRFASHFTKDFYYDCGDEEAPFGNDEGSDTLYALGEYIKKNKDADIAEFPYWLVAKEWSMDFFPPDDIRLDTIKEQLSISGENTLPISQQIMLCDQVIVAAAFGQIKIMGYVNNHLKNMAERSLQRVLLLTELLGWEKSLIVQQMLKDLQSFENPDLFKSSDTAQSIIKLLDCPCTVFNQLMNDDDIIYSYEAACKEGKEQGYTPLIIIVDDNLQEMMEYAMDTDGENDIEKYKHYCQQVIKEASALDGKHVLEEMWEQLQEERLEAEDELELKNIKVEEGEKIDRFSSYWDYASKLTNEIILAKIPTCNPWELAVWMPMGGFNDCPAPQEQAAVMRYWYEQYGAVPGVVSSDTWEFTVDNPISNKDAAVALACEQYAFCTDRVDQGTSDGTIGNLADCLMQSTVWYFWWD